MLYTELRKAVTDGGRWKRQVKKDRAQWRGCCFGGQMRRGLGGSPDITKSGRVRKKRLEKRSLEFDYAAVESLG